MPSIRKRIGYLPSPSIQELVIKIANNEKLSQSKVVGILVEEALLARGLIDSQNFNNLNRKNLNNDKRNNNDYSFKNNELDEMISDKGITYNQKKYQLKKNHSSNISPEPKEQCDGKLFEQFKQFIEFQEMLREK